MFTRKKVTNANTAFISFNFIAVVKKKEMVMHFSEIRRYHIAWYNLVQPFVTSQLFCQLRGHVTMKVFGMDLVFNWLVHGFFSSISTYSLDFGSVPYLMELACTHHVRPIDFYKTTFSNLSYSFTIYGERYEVLCVLNLWWGQIAVAQ